MADNEDTKIVPEQISQNYLIDPADFYKTNPAENEDINYVELPKENNPLDNTKQIEETDLNVNQTQSPTNILQSPGSEAKELEKNFDKLKEILKSNYDPAIKNLYSLVSAMANKKTAPQSFTEERPSFSGGKYFFDEELQRITQKVEWS